MMKSRNFIKALRLYSSFIIILFFILISSKSYGQVLHTESFSVILDTTKRIKGSIVPDFKFQTVKKNLIEFENTADITLKLKKNALTVANKVELEKYGNELQLSSGYLYVEYRNTEENRISFERFMQIIWAGSRGLQFKYAGGLYTRFRIIKSQNVGFFFGAGTFYENEQWNYEGVKDSLLIPPTAENIYSELVKIGSYLSYKWETDFNFSFDCSIYHQSRIKYFFVSPRFASSTSVTYNFTEHVGLRLQYDNIYDYKPVVPIEKLYNKIIFTMEVTF